MPSWQWFPHACIPSFRVIYGTYCINWIKRRRWKQNYRLTPHKIQRIWRLFEDYEIKLDTTIERISIFRQVQIWASPQTLQMQMTSSATKGAKGENTWVPDRYCSRKYYEIFEYPELINYRTKSAKPVNLRHPLSSLLSPQLSIPLHLYPLSIHRPLEHVNCQKWQGLGEEVVFTGPEVPDE